MPGIWSRHRDEITIDRLQKFWNELPIQARNNLLRIDKQTLFEQARKNLYCSRCNGLLLESFTQIVMYGKSLQNHEGNLVNSYMDQEDDEVAQDPAVHPWGGLAATKDGLLTLLDCFINARSLNPLQNVFDSARGREREREMLYPDACGGEGRGWISQSGSGTGGYGRGTRETCALHTARLSCDTLMDFWSALGDETRASLLQMKEDDFIERLMYRFDSKRFCRDCRRNVIREFKELKELKRLRREPRCNILFCGADTAFQYEVSDTTVQADWQDFFTECKYHHFEWGVGTSEGKGDICEFKNIGLISKVSRTDLELSQYTSLYIGLRAWRNDGKYSEYCVKAHAMKGRLCVHRRLVVGDGVVSITKGESMRRFFEHAEEAEEEDEEDAMERDGSDLDGDGAHPQKHAKSPELAREFLLDAATVIFKEQVEKAFREGTARQNAHSVFVSLALKLLEDRVHVACKEIITLEKQTMLLEEEEKEKREEEERKERRRNKEREKKLRRKERLSLKGSKENREKESEQELEQKSPSHHHDKISELKSPESPKSESPLKFPEITPCATEMDCQNEQDESFIVEQSKSTRRKLKLSCSNDNNSGNNNNKNGTIVKKSNRGCDLSYRSRYEYSQNTCGCGDQQNMYKPRQPYYRSTKYLNNGYASETVQKVSSNSNGTVTGTVKKDVSLKQVWEPMDSRKKTVASTSASNNNTSSTDFKAVPTSDKVTDTCQKHEVPRQNGNANHSEACANNSKNEESFQNTKNAGNNNNCNGSPVNNCNGSPANSCNGSPVNNQTGDIDNCSSCLSENDSSSTSISSGAHNDSSSTSDSEDQHSEKSEKTFLKDPPKDSELQSNPQTANVNNPPQSVSKVREIAVNSPPPVRIGIVPVPVSTQPVHMSAAYYPNVGLGFHNGAVPVYPFAQTGHYNPYPNHHLGYGVPSLHYNGPAVHPLHYNGPAVQPLPVYKQHGVRVGLNSDLIANRRVVLPENPNPVRKSNISMCQQPMRPSSNNNNNNSNNNIEGNGNCNSVKNGERNGGLQSFSLFHFGGPVASRDHAKLERESNGGVQCERKGEDNVKEYNLFSSSQGSFSFF